MLTGVDFDLDVDVDIDTDLDIDAITNIEGGNIDFQDIANTEVNKEDVVGKKNNALKWWQVTLIYFNFVGLPFMFTFTCWIFIWWFCTIVTTSITHSYDNTFGFIIFLVAIIPSLILTKIFTSPFKQFFKSFKQDGDTPIDLIGRTGNITFPIENDELGLAEVIIQSKVMSVYVKSLDGSLINHNKEVLIIKQSFDKNFYYIKSYTN
jgi:hypothetical protein